MGSYVWCIFVGGACCNDEDGLTNGVIHEGRTMRWRVRVKGRGKGTEVLMRRRACQPDTFVISLAAGSCRVRGQNRQKVQVQRFNLITPGEVIEYKPQKAQLCTASNDR